MDDTQETDSCSANNQCEDGFVCARVWRRLDSDEASAEDIADETDAEDEAESELEDLVEGGEDVVDGEAPEAQAAPEEGAAVADRALFDGQWSWRTPVKRCVRKY